VSAEPTNTREGYVDAARILREGFAAKPVLFAGHVERQPRVDAAIEELCRALNVDPIWLVDRIIAAKPTHAAPADHDMVGHLLMCALAVVAPKGDPALAPFGVRS
jgi:hypothetical protein